MRIVQRRKRIDEHAGWRRSFCYKLSDPHSGFCFSCDEQGDILPGLNPDAQANYKRAMAMVKRGEMRDLGVSEERHRGWKPRIGLCDCGKQVHLEGFTNTCHGCGADYNHAGQRLAPRSQWGEETGESVADILSVDR